ncbi:hypothetical protein VW29_04335 [Devosia limi DSM 17137]|uniref:Uncharacterized protein n=1 Tax=Devosia limi DSM 17137 TaxID=1121477 RepID=A0A0F5LUW1_9HYPH|nr:hypothetical protein [Devosia limi]KKB86113.1 hypothetical protein VW29_04335 [Devosia limi DSM 17137]SHF85634.1 hypothetical protein SAMN02745223_03733 [Devosia limi DSM 17137]
MQERFHYSLERYHGDDDVDEFGVDVVLQEATHRINIMVREWIEALTVHEVGQDQIFSPIHTFGSFHGDEIEGEIRETAHHAWFYKTRSLALEVDEIGPPDYQFYSECRMLLDTSIITMFVGMSTPVELTPAAEDEIHDRVVKAAKAHAEGNSCIFFFSGRVLAHVDAGQLH